MNSLAFEGYFLNGSTGKKDLQIPQLAMQLDSTFNQDLAVLIITRALYLTCD
jgi:hypothetical protein